MIQADRVLSTPPTNTSLTRRGALGSAVAALAAGAAVNVTAMATGLPVSASEPDPIFAAIDVFRRADAAVDAVVDAGDDIPDELADRRDTAYSAALRTRPTTPAGLAALTTWAREQTNWLHANASGMLAEDVCALSATMDDAVRGMSGLKPWSPQEPDTAAADDPVFELITVHRKAYAEFLAALVERNRLEILGDPSHEDFDEDQCVAATDAFEALIEAPLATFAGVVALITHLKEFSETEGWMFEEGAALPLIANLAEALPRLAVS
jgi:hypothetical protein